jgi:hypothetical protein
LENKVEDAAEAENVFQYRMPVGPMVPVNYSNKPSNEYFQIRENSSN